MVFIHEHVTHVVHVQHDWLLTTYDRITLVASILLKFIVIYWSQAIIMHILYLGSGNMVCMGTAYMHKWAVPGVM